MAFVTYRVFAETTDFGIQSDGAGASVTLGWDEARNGLGTLGTSVASHTAPAGRLQAGAVDVNVWQYPVQFDLSAVPVSFADDTDITLGLYNSGNVFASSAVIEGYLIANFGAPGTGIFEDTAGLADYLSASLSFAISGTGTAAQQYNEGSEQSGATSIARGIISLLVYEQAQRTNPAPVSAPNLASITMPASSSVTVDATNWLLDARITTFETAEGTNQPYIDITIETNANFVAVDLTGSPSVLGTPQLIVNKVLAATDLTGAASVLGVPELEIRTAPEDAGISFFVDSEPLEFFVKTDGLDFTVDAEPLTFFVRRE